jgi:hypothetical protein
MARAVAPYRDVPSDVPTVTRQAEVSYASAALMELPDPAA